MSKILVITRDIFEEQDVSDSEYYLKIYASDPEIVSGEYSTKTTNLRIKICSRRKFAMNGKLFEAMVDETLTNDEAAQIINSKMPDKQFSDHEFLKIHANRFGVEVEVLNTLTGKKLHIGMPERLILNLTKQLVIRFYADVLKGFEYALFQIRG